MAVRADAARMGQRLGDQVTYQGQEDEISPAQTEAAPLFADGLPGFDQAAIGPLPGGGEEHPIPCARSSPSSLAESAVSMRAGFPPASHPVGPGRSRASRAVRSTSASASASR